ncbi:MAG: hypothetical protein ABI538_00575 [Pseudoxanthomonas sp.]
MRVLRMILLVCAFQAGGNSQAQAQRQQIGQVQGKPVYADQVSGQDARSGRIARVNGSFNLSCVRGICSTPPSLR